MYPLNVCQYLIVHTQVQAKDLQKMFMCYGLAKEVKIYLEHDIRYVYHNIDMIGRVVL